MQAVTRFVETSSAPIGAIIHSESALLKQHDKLIRHVAKAFSGSGIPQEDLLQEGRMALLERIRTFRPDHGASLWTYAFKRVLGAMLNACKSEYERTANRAEDDALEGVAAPAVSPDLRAECLGFSSSGLDETEWKVVLMRAVDDLSFREITRELELSSFDKTERIYRAAIAKLRSRFEVAK